MAKLSIRSWRDEAGHPVHPVARVLVTLPDPGDGWGSTLVRLTLRSDGAILQSVKGSSRWGGHSVLTTTPTGFPCCGAQTAMSVKLGMFASARYAARPGVVVEPEYLDPSAGVR